MAKISNYLGVDLGASGIKVINLASDKKKTRLITYGYMERSQEEIAVDWFTDLDYTASLLKKICAKAKTTTVQAATALPIAAVFNAVLSLPKIAKKELESSVRWEAKKLIPLPLEEVVLDWKLLPSIPVSKTAAVQKNQETKEGEQKTELKEKKENPIEVLLTGAPKSLVQKHTELFKKAGLNLLSLETESFAFVRSLVGNDPSSVAIVDIGAKKSNIILIDRGIPFLSRSIEIGGKNFTEKIAEKLNIPLDQAEEIKRNVSEMESLTELPLIIKEVLTPLFNEIKYSFNIYRTRNVFNRPIEKIILSGGSAFLPGICEYFTQFFNLRTFLGDPWARLSYPDELKPILQSIGSRFSVAIGLAMRETE